jgi:hypothetical protein
LPTAITINDGAHTGVVNYPDIRCSGKLRVLGIRGSVATYRERILHGRCVDNGVWKLKFVASRLGGTWRARGHNVFVVGYMR